MAGAKEIRSKIASVRNTQKITKAMEMVAASKMRKTQERMSASRPYVYAIRKVISHIAKANVDYVHPFLEPREVKKAGYLVVSTDRGLCGGLNVNLFKAVLNEFKAQDDKGVKTRVGVIGSKATSFFQNMGVEIAAQVTGLGDNPELETIVGIVGGMIERYRNGEVDEVYVVYNRFENTMSQKPTVQKLLPLPTLEDDSLESNSNWTYDYEPDAKSLLDSLLVRYLEAQVYQAIVDNLASEQAARMVAMKAATDNAGNIIKDLQLVYNKARQASITNELNEIVAGAAAI